MKLLKPISALLALFFIMLATQQAQSQIIYQSSTPGVYTVTITQSSLYHVETWGGGGRGGPRANDNGGTGGGGGGAYSKSTLSLAAGTYTVKVGQGGQEPGNADGDSSYVKSGTTLLVLAMGGQGVNANSATGRPGGQAANGIGAIKYSGGNGANGTTAGTLFGGGGGSSAGTGSNGNNGSLSVGGAAVAGGGAGGNGRTLTDGPGIAGTGPGGAGGGARKTTNGGGQINGGLGAAGKVVITLACLPPSISVAADDVTVECDGTGNTTELNAWLTSNGGAVVINGCGAITWSNNFTALSNDCGATGAATVTFVATDANGNTASTTATFTIEDTTLPDAQCQNVTLEFDEYGNVSTTAGDVDNGSSDACGSVTLSLSQVDFDCTDLGNNTVILTVTDECGNTSTCEATVTVIVPVAWRCHDGEKVIFCHVPPNWPAQNIQEICVSMDIETICDHLGHGDHFGPCDGTEVGFAITNTHVDPEASSVEKVVIQAPVEEQKSIVTSIKNHPNPFTDKTEIRLSLNRSEYVTLKIYNHLGKEVSTLYAGKLDAGEHRFSFDGSNQLDGFFYYRLAAGETLLSGTMIRTAR